MADDLVSEIMRLGMQTIIQKHVEEEQADQLGRGRYERVGEHRDYGNGYYETAFKTMAGRLAIDVPRVRGKVLLHLEAAASESTDAWSDFFEDMRRRGLRQPLYVVSDGCNALKAAITRHFPHSDRGRYIVHKLGNVANKVPQDGRKEVLRQAKGVYFAPTYPTMV